MVRHGQKETTRTQIFKFVFQMLTTSTRTTEKDKGKEFVLGNSSRKKILLLNRIPSIEFIEI